MNPPGIPFLAALLWLSLLGAIVANIQPMFLGGLAQSLSLNAQQIGYLGGAELTGACFASLCAPLWFNRVNLRVLTIFALLVATTGNFLTGWVSSYQVLLCLRFFTAFLGAGVIYCMSLGFIGQQENPDRLIAIAIIMQVFSLALGMLVIPLLLVNWQLQGLTLALTLLYITGLLAAPFVPAGASQEDSGKHPGSKGRATVENPAGPVGGTHPIQFRPRLYLGFCGAHWRRGGICHLGYWQSTCGRWHCRRAWCRHSGRIGAARRSTGAAPGRDHRAVGRMLVTE